MISEFNFKLKDVGIINEADIGIGKINVIGGNNSTGKSTSSKILYSFLRANSKSRQDLAKNSLIDELLETAMDSYVVNNSRELRNFIDELHQKRFKNSEINIEKTFGQLKSLVDVGDDLEKLVEIYADNGKDLFQSIFNQLLRQEFGKSFAGEISFSGKFNDAPFSYKTGLEGQIVIDDVFYLDTFALFDLLSDGGLQNTEHIEHVFKSIRQDKSGSWADEIKNSEIIRLEEMILEIIGGTFVYDNQNILFRSKNQEFLMKNTASGIKQIGVIQLLLNTRKLRQNSFLIIDEPEVNLHPKWQIKLAQILVLLVKNLNISIYINSHGPLFIEAIKTFAEKYDLLDETNFYLTYPNDTKFDIKYVPTDELNIIYNSLGEPYEHLSRISIDNQFR